MSVIRSNLTSQTTQSQIQKNRSALDTAIERLSSGLRINSAKDDAAGQAIANRFTANINGLAQAARNANDGISMSQTAQGVLDEINHRLQRIRQLTVQGLSDIYKGETGDRLQAEINMNLKEIDRLNQWASFNGIPLLDGSAGTKSLQVGAHDGETIPVDLNPPGFSVAELGLLDLTVQGAPDRITPVSSLTGTSSLIDLDDAVHTNVNYVPPDNSPNLVRISQTNRSVVQINGPQGRLQNVSISASHDTDTRENQVRLGVSNAVVLNTGAESISSRTYLDENGDQLNLPQPAIVRSDGRFWIQHQYAGGTYYYEAELRFTGNQHQITAQAKSNTRISSADMPGKPSEPLRYMPVVSRAAANYTLALDGTDETANGSFELVRLGNEYYVEEATGPDQYAYYRATVDVTTDGTQSKIHVESQRSQAISVTDQQYVGGTSTAHLIPTNENVQVDYVDLAGRVFTDVMRADEDGDYIFHLGEFTNSEGAYKTAKVVRNQEGRYLLQTVNGAAEVMLYYPLYYTRGNPPVYEPAFSLSTNVENNHTVLTLREADVARRLRTPPEPLAAIDAAIARVDAKRSAFGALDNRLNTVIQSNTLTGANLEAARSRIQDADYAIEVAALTRAQILQQAGTSVLAQANQLPQTVMTLLRG